MKRATFVSLALVAGLGACTLSDQQRMAIRQAAIANIEAWNAAGIDPLQASPQLQAAMLATCTTATMIMTVINPNMPVLGQAGLDFCTVVAHAAGKAQ